MQPKMPMYKFHEAPRAPTAFVGPPTATPSVVINPNAPRPPPQHLYRPGPAPQHLPHSAIAAHPARILTAHPMQQQHIQHLQPHLPHVPQQHFIGQQAALKEQPVKSHVANLESAHFGHSLYFIEHLFPSKLWRILDDAERCGYHNVISWVDNGMAFQIHDRENVIPILEKFFNMSKFKSFLRQLQAYGFQRVSPNAQDDPCRDSKPKKDTYRGKWSHPLFRRDRMNLCNKMTRDGSAKKEEKAKPSTDSGGNSPVQKDIAPKPDPAPSRPSHSPLPPSAVNLHQRVNQSQIAIAQHHQQQKQLAAQQQQQQQRQRQQQQQQQQQQMQLAQTRMIQIQPHHPHAPHSHPPAGAPVYHHNPRLGPPPQHHSLAGAHHPHHPPAGVHYPLPPGVHAAPPGTPLPHAAAAPIPNAATGITPAMMAHAKQRQEEHQRQQIQMMQKIKGQQLLSTILGRPAEASPGTAPATTPGAAARFPIQLSPGVAPSASAPAPVELVKGVNYNTAAAHHSLSRVSPPGSPAAPSVVGKVSSATSAAVSEATDELRRAEEALVERRKRLATAQQIAQDEAQAIAKAEAAVRAVHSSSGVAIAGNPPAGAAAATRTATSVARELLLPKHPQFAPATAPATAPQPAATMLPIDPQPPGGKTAGAPKSTTEGLSITSLLQDLDNAFKTSAIPPPPTWVAPAAQVKESTPTDSSGKATTTISQVATGTNDQLRITDEEMQHARAETAATPKSTAAAATALASAPGDSSTGPSASERKVILARLNAMEQIRLQEQEKQKKETERLKQQQQRSQQRQQLLMNFAKAELEGKPPVVQIADNSTTSPAVRDAIRSAAVGLISGGGNTVTANLILPVVGTTSAALGGAPPSSATTSGIAERINPPTSVLPQVPTSTNPPKILSKEMMDIFAKTAAAAIKGKSDSGSDRNTSPSPAVAGPASLLGTVPGISTSGALPANIPKLPPTISLNPPIPASSVISNSELEAARLLMRIPGKVTKPNGTSLTGHWELVRPEELKKGNPLAKNLPHVVNKSAELTYEAYKNLAMKMSPPNVMRVPENWDARKEPVYLVVDPANAPTSVLPPAATASTSMAMAIAGAPPAAAHPAPTVSMHQGADAAAAFRAANLR